MPELVSLPVELLDQIIQLVCATALTLPEGDRADFPTCWTLRCAVVPKVFRRLEIDSTNRLQLECLATAGTVSNLASAVHTKELRVTLGRDGKALSDVMSTVSALKAVEQVELRFWAERTERLSFVSLLTLLFETVIVILTVAASIPITGLTLLWTAYPLH
jgi:hypothetical protein